MNDSNLLSTPTTNRPLVTTASSRPMFPSWLRVTGLGLLGLLLLATAAYGGYYWEHMRAASTETKLQQQVDNLKKQSAESSTPSTRTALNPGGTLPCVASSLVATQVATSHAAGTTGITYSFSNSSAAACTLTSSPVVTLSDANKNTLGSPATPTKVVSDVTIIVQPKAAAYATVLFPDSNNFTAGQCSSEEATNILFALSSDTSAKFGTTISGQKYCPGFAVQPFTSTAP